MDHGDLVCPFFLKYVPSLIDGSDDLIGGYRGVDLLERFLVSLVPGTSEVIITIMMNYIVLLAWECSIHSFPASFDEKQGSNH